MTKSKKKISKFAKIEIEKDEEIKTSLEEMISKKFKNLKLVDIFELLKNQQIKYLHLIEYELQ